MCARVCGRQAGGRSVVVPGGEGRAGPGREGHLASSEEGGTWSDTSKPASCPPPGLGPLRALEPRAGPSGECQERQFMDLIKFFLWINKISGGLIPEDVLL